MLIVAIIGRLVTPKPTDFLPRELRISPYATTGRTDLRASPNGWNDRAEKESGPGWTGLHYFSRFHTSLRKSVLPGQTMLGERGWDAG
jgi:hypothetical protein